jgi:hypothetical protein
MPRYEPDGPEARRAEFEEAQAREYELQALSDYEVDLAVERWKAQRANDFTAHLIDLLRPL